MPFAATSKSREPQTLDTSRGVGSYLGAFPLPRFSQTLFSLVQGPETKYSLRSKQASVSVMNLSQGEREEPYWHFQDMIVVNSYYLLSKRTCSVLLGGF